MACKALDIPTSTTARQNARRAGATTIIQLARTRRPGNPLARRQVTTWDTRVMKCGRKVKGSAFHSHSMMMAIRHPSEKLVQEALQDVGLQAPLANIEILLEVLVEILEHEGELTLGVHHVV